MKLAINMQNLSFHYEGAHPILKLDAFEVKKQEKIFIYGPSGCGKSTLLGLIAGMFLPQQGTLEVFGLDFCSISRSKRDEIRGKEIGYIFQTFNLIPYLSCLENILLPCIITRQRKTKIIGPLEQEAALLAEHLNLTEVLHKKARQLSVGQQQRVAAARALIGNPQLVIADEPTSSLDGKNTNEFLKLLLRKWEEKKFTLVFVSHDERLANDFNRSISLPELNRIKD
jgi:putative ABC transport system ATP-binding protein|tara:strand:+ start:483 stop:1163 length:681 start_codon:yes stop_codon:yes gene_type:complete